MNIDLDEKELKILIYATSMYQVHMRETNKELAGMHKRRREENLGGCCGWDIGEEKIPFHHDDNYIALLRDKLKKQQMLFPIEEHIHLLLD